MTITIIRIRLSRKLYSIFLKMKSFRCFTPARQITCPAREHVDGPVMVQTAQVVKRHADLQDPLIQPANVPPLGTPQQFKGLVLLEVLPAIELTDSVEQRERWGLVTRRHDSASNPLLRRLLRFL